MTRNLELPLPRVLRVYTRRRPLDIHDAEQRIVGLAATAMLGALLIMLYYASVEMSFWSRHWSPLWVVLAAAAISGFVGAAIWMMVTLQPEQRRNLPRFRLRRRRLACIEAHPAAARRLPHRLVESAYIKAHAHEYPNSRKLLRLMRSLLPQLPRDTVIAVNVPTDLPFGPTAVAFEPVDTRHGDSMMNLAALQLEALHVKPEKIKRMTFFYLFGEDGYQAEEPAEQASSVARKVSHGVRRALVPAVVTGIVWALFAVSGATIRETLLDAARIAGSTTVIMVVGMIVLAVFACWFMRGLLGRRTILVPGGIVQAREPIWRSAPTITHFRRGDSVVVFDMAHLTAIVCHNGQCTTFPFDGATFGGWLSTARPPTDQEVQSLLGASGDD